MPLFAVLSDSKDAQAMSLGSGRQTTSGPALDSILCWPKGAESGQKCCWDVQPNRVFPPELYGEGMAPAFSSSHYIEGAYVFSFPLLTPALALF